MRMKHTLILVATLCLASALGLHHVWRWWHQPFPDQRMVYLTISSGSSLRSVATTLSDMGALRYPELWRVVARARGVDNQIKRGEYQLTADLSPAMLLDELVAGRVVQYSITLPEGITLAEAIHLLWGRPELRQTLDGAQDTRLLALAAPHASGEGLFFPDTYHFARDDSDYDVAHHAYQRMQMVLATEWANRQQGLPYQTPYEALIMASIVEKETGMAAERKRIAGVFVRRLQKRMRLQTDPAVIYGLGTGFDGNLRRKHLEDTSNPFNTYRHRGLPPTPIGLPGLAALRAALHPAAGSELYFVARGDGSHAFSDTLEQHMQAVRTWQLNRASNYRSSPATTNET